MNTASVPARVVPGAGRVASSGRRSWAGRLTSRLGAFGLTAALGAAGMSTLVPMMCAPAPASSTQTQVVASTNQQRAGVGVAAVRVNASLTQAAQAHANDQAAVDRMSHTGTDGSNAGTRISRTGYPVRAWGENVAAGYGTADAVMAAWMASPSHRANIVSGTFTQIGIAVAYAADGTPYWAMALARPW